MITTLTMRKTKLSNQKRVFTVTNIRYIFAKRRLRGKKCLDEKWLSVLRQKLPQKENG